MRKLEIIIDIDDTLMDCISICCEMVKEKYGYNVPIEEVKCWNFMNQPDNIREALFQTFDTDELYNRQRPIPGAVAMIDTLRKRGHHIIFFSSVGWEKMTTRARQIKKYFGAEAGDIVLGGNKDKMQADIILDDALHNVLSSKCKYPVLMRQPWNKNETKILSVRNYEEFLELVDKIAAAPVEKEIIAMNHGTPGMIAVVGPIASGKTSFIEELIKDPRFAMVTSTTTRPDDGTGKYRHVPKEQFEQIKDNGEFAEYSFYEGEWYGIKNADIQSIWESGRIAVKAMDIHGALELKGNLGSKVVTVFIRRNKEAILENIISQATPDKEKAIMYILNLDAEFQNEYRCDWTISNNGDIKDAVEQLLRIIK